jgi:radical SAM protein with 4Fe4S-binding SPASM domain
MTGQSLKGKRPLIVPSSIASEFWSRVDQSGGPDACWPWTQSIEEHGYGQLNWKALGGHCRAHVVAYELTYGEIPLDPELERRLDVDHKCHNADLSCPGGPCVHRSCCNPRHLTVKTTIVNKDSADHPRKRGIVRERCRYGHEFTEENTIWTHRSKPRPGKAKVRASEKRCRTCEYTKMCKQPECASERHDHEGTPWPKGNYALILASRLTTGQTGSPSLLGPIRGTT